jgi:hypothetical protein
MPPTFVEMSDSEWDEAIDLLAEILTPALDLVLSRRDPTQRAA